MEAIFIFSVRAQEEFKEAVRWYEESKSGLGKDLEKEVWNKIDYIITHPNRYPIHKGNYRQTLINRFPYLIIYRYNRLKQQITIASIFHTSRNPKNKYRK